MNHDLLYSTVALALPITSAAIIVGRDRLLAPRRGALWDHYGRYLSPMMVWVSTACGLTGAWMGLFGRDGPVAQALTGVGVGGNYTSFLVGLLVVVWTDPQPERDTPDAP